MVRLGGRDHRVQGDLDAAVGAVLEADRAGQPGGQLAVDLALGGARAMSRRAAPRRPRPGASIDTASNILVLPAPFSPVSTIKPFSGMNRASQWLRQDRQSVAKGKIV